MYPREARTAMGAAFIRAAHIQTGHSPYVFEDYLADALLNAEEGDDFRGYFARQYTAWCAQPWFASHADGFTGDPFTGYMRTSPLVPEVLARQAFAEGILTDYRAAFRQYVILGAGLDTFAHRNLNAQIVVYEVDRVEVSRFKQVRASSLGCVPERAPVYVPMRIDRDNVGDRLLSSGLRREMPTFVSCLGLTPYLTLENLAEMFVSVRRVLCEGSIIAYDYTRPEALSPVGGCPFTIELAKRLGQLGDPLHIDLNTDGYETLLQQSGFRLLEHLAPPDIQARYFSNRRDGLSAASHVCLAAAIAA